VEDLSNLPYKETVDQVNNTITKFIKFYKALEPILDNDSEILDYKTLDKVSTDYHPLKSAGEYFSASSKIKNYGAKRCPKNILL